MRQGQKLQYTNECIIKHIPIDYDQGILVRSKMEDGRYKYYYLSSAALLEEWLARSPTCPLTRSTNIEYIPLNQLDDGILDQLSSQTDDTSWTLTEDPEDFTIPELSAALNALAWVKKNSLVTALIYTNTCPVLFTEIEHDQGLLVRAQDESTQKYTYYFLSSQAVIERIFQTTCVCPITRSPLVEHIPLNLLDEAILTRLRTNEGNLWTLKDHEAISNDQTLVQLLSLKNWTINAPPQETNESLVVEVTRILKELIADFKSLDPERHISHALMSLLYTMTVAIMAGLCMISTTFTLLDCLVTIPWMMLKLITCHSIQSNIDDWKKAATEIKKTLQLTSYIVVFPLLGGVHAILYPITVVLKCVNQILQPMHYLIRKNNLGKIQEKVEKINADFQLVTPPLFQARL